MCLCFTAFLSLYIVLIDVLIYSAAPLKECLINLLTYLHDSFHYEVFSVNAGCSNAVEGIYSDCLLEISAASVTNQ